MSEAEERLSRFLVQHERCGGASVEPPSETDVTETGYWVTIRCPACGDTIREERDWATTVRELSAYIGMSPQEFEARAFEAGDVADLERLLAESPRAMPDVLLRILRAQAQRGERFDN
jgi:hypothetical protein